MLALGCLNGLAEAVLGGDALVGRLGQQKLALEAVQFGLVSTVVVFLGDGQPFVQSLERILVACALRVCIAQDAEIVRNPHFRAGGSEGMKSLEEKGQRLG